MSSGPGREDKLGDESRQREEVSPCETALRGLLGINGGMMRMMLESK